ncbi:GntR family transcriptional regulator [Actinomyces sp. B33]|uniref:GntR family transcriptional regulator n=1 Tax=Actinomyces sp. B33 TaxID=2942131 RepID=UPI002341F872|nr:GntR family transcriptional regulator [Actinomyces sp. B33]MDC4233738.1 GntR family transcriptional regulator [Actinomyces sp. B33]
MQIVLSNSSDQPIYEQISTQIARAILDGDLDDGHPLPSIRALANDLRVSVITTKRAYSDLERLGYITTIHGKGSYVAGGNRHLLREQRLRRVEESLTDAIDSARTAGLSLDDLHTMLDALADTRP